MLDKYCCSYTCMLTTAANRTQMLIVLYQQYRILEVIFTKKLNIFHYLFLVEPGNYFKLVPLNSDLEFIHVQ